MLSLKKLSMNYSEGFYNGAVFGNDTSMGVMPSVPWERRRAIIELMAISGAALLLFLILLAFLGFYCRWRRDRARAQRVRVTLSNRIVDWRVKRVTNNACSECQSSDSIRSDRATYAPSICSHVESITDNDSNDLNYKQNNLNKPEMITNNTNTSVPQKAFRAGSSVPLSPGMGTLYSSIDFDNFEESPFYGNTKKYHSEGNFSSLFSEASIGASGLINSNSVLSVGPNTQMPSSSLFHLVNPSAQMVEDVLNFIREFAPGRNHNVRLSLKFPSAQEIGDMPPIRPSASTPESDYVTPSAPKWVDTMKTPPALESTNRTTSPLVGEALRAVPLGKSELSIDKKIKVGTLSTSLFVINKRNNLSNFKRRCASKLRQSKSMESKISAWNKCLVREIPRSQSVLPNVSFKVSSLQGDGYDECVIQANRNHNND